MAESRIAFFFDETAKVEAFRNSKIAAVEVVLPHSRVCFHFLDPPEVSAAKARELADAFTQTARHFETLKGHN